MESISEVDFDYVLIATVDPDVADAVKRRLTGLGVPAEKTANRRLSRRISEKR